MNTYLEKFHHGITALDGYGGYSHHPVSYLTAIVSSYEVGDVLEALKKKEQGQEINIEEFKDLLIIKMKR